MQQKNWNSRITSVRLSNLMTSQKSVNTDLSGHFQTWIIIFWIPRLISYVNQSRYSSILNLCARLHESIVISFIGQKIAATLMRLIFQNVNSAMLIFGWPSLTCAVLHTWTVNEVTHIVLSQKNPSNLIFDVRCRKKERKLSGLLWPGNAERICRGRNDQEHWKKGVKRCWLITNAEITDTLIPGGFLKTDSGIIEYHNWQP